MRKLIWWRKRDDGVVAVEFALIAIPFFVLLLGTIETSLFFASGAVLEGAAADAARLIRTGQAQQSADPEQMFEDELCEMVGVMINCNNLQYEVIRMTGDTFSDAESNQPAFDDDGNLEPGVFDAGNSNDVILVRAVYRYEFLTPYLGTMITGDPSRNWSIHMASVVIRSEPYVFGEN